ncbi:uncharacterized protein LOC142495428 isoform X1 [Ascaphus truei]|uniref:uncharacterized protein LOC142495428 isoform X1 n=1 Tax=Ascaphus truei TaxID=8439 RepID=UPI003F5A845C
MQSTLAFQLLASVLLCLKGAAAKADEKVDCSAYSLRHAAGEEFACATEHFPVCGTDHVTYGNQCTLCDKILTTGAKIGIKHQGKCSALVEIRPPSARHEPWLGRQTQRSMQEVSSGGFQVSARISAFNIKEDVPALRFTNQFVAQMGNPTVTSVSCVHRIRESTSRLALNTMDIAFKKIGCL